MILRMPEQRKPQEVETAKSTRRRKPKTTKGGKDKTRFMIAASLKEVSFSGESKDSRLFVVMFGLLFLGLWGTIAALRADLDSLVHILSLLGIAGK